MRRSLRSFTFFIKECKRTLHSFWFHKSYKNCKSRKKKNVKECSVLFIWLKKNLTFIFQYIFFNIYLYISIFISIYIYIYLNICIEKRNATFCVLLQKNETFWRCLRSFPFLRKERKRTHRSFGFHKLPKTQKKNAKECCVL